MKVTQPSDGHYHIHLDKNFDFECHKEFRQYVGEAMGGHALSLAIDFSNVEYVDSSALGMLMLAKQDADLKKCPITLVNVPPRSHARQILELVKFDKVFKIQYA